MSSQTQRKIVIRLTLAVIVILLLISSITFIPTGYTGVRVTFGRIEEGTLNGGTVNLTVPFIQHISMVNNKQVDKKIQSQIWGETVEKTPIYATDVVITTQVQSDKTAYLLQTVSDMDNLVSDSMVASAVKSAMSELTVDEVSVRSKIEPLAKEKLQESIDEKYGIDAIYVNKITINNMDFEDAYNEAIQQKSIAQQTAEKQKIENQTAIDKAEADKQVAITKAEATAEALKISAEAEAEANQKIAESISDTLNEYKKIEKWNGALPTVTGGNAIIALDENNEKE